MNLILAYQTTNCSFSFFLNNVYFLSFTFGTTYNLYSSTYLEFAVSVIFSNFRFGSVKIGAFQCTLPTLNLSYHFYPSSLYK